MIDKIVWDEYLCRGEIQKSPLFRILMIEREIGYKLPKLLGEIIRWHGGQSPENLQPKLPNGQPFHFECIYHAFPNDPEDSVYTIQSGYKALVDEGYSNLVPFAHRGNVFICLDYQQSVPSVVYLFRDYMPSDPQHKVLIDDSFDDFIANNLVDLQ